MESHGLGTDPQITEIVGAGRSGEAEIEDVARRLNLNLARALGHRQGKRTIVERGRRTVCTNDDACNRARWAAGRDIEHSAHKRGIRCDAAWPSTAAKGKQSQEKEDSFQFPPARTVSCRVLVVLLATKR